MTGEGLIAKAIQTEAFRAKDLSSTRSTLAWLARFLGLGFVTLHLKFQVSPKRFQFGVPWLQTI